MIENSIQPKDIRKRWILIAILGSIIWGIVSIFYLFDSSELLTDIELILLFGISITIPLAIRLAIQEDRYNKLPKIIVLATFLYPFSAISITIGLIIGIEWIALVLALIWQVQTILFFLYGLWRLLQRQVIAVEEICIDFGLLYMPISGVWVISYILGYALLTFNQLFVLLTAVHFSFISPTALIIIGMIGRQLSGSKYRKFYIFSASLAIISPLCVAIGITLTQFSAGLWLEAGSVLVLAISFLLLLIITLIKGLPQNTISRILLIISCLSLLVTMTFAIAYSIGRFSGRWDISLDTMIQWHGWLNAAGFTFCAILAWTIETPENNVSRYGIPFSRLPWRYRIGASFFDRIEAINEPSNPLPTGIVDDLSNYQQDGFQAQDVLPAITAFYEYTDRHELLVYPEWQTIFKPLSRIYKQFSQFIGQMNFPLQPDSDETLISSEIIPLRDELDKRENVRGWVRVYPKTGKAVYVVAYSSHIYNEHRYMNIAFPLPFGNLTSILKLQTGENFKGGLLLTSFSQRMQDQGVYFANRLCPIRLPINETIRVVSASNLYQGYPDNFAVGDVVAEHKMWIFGIHFLTLHYSIRAEK